MAQEFCTLLHSVPSNACHSVGSDKKKKVFACVDTSLAIHADHTDVHSSAGHLLYSEKSFLANEFDVVSSLAIT